MIVLFSVAAWGQASGQTAPTTQQLNALNAKNICRVYFTTPKGGSASQLEQARQKHMQFHKSQGDTWTWNTWEISTGEHTGTYVTSTCGHVWKDFDDWDKKMGKVDAADAAASMGPFQQASWNGFYVYRADMSLAPADRAPSAMDSVTIYVLHPGTAPEFTAAVSKINAALSKQSDWPKTSGWLQLANGGEGPTFVLLNARQSWADYAPLDKSVADVLNEAYGKEGADATLKVIRDSTAHVLTETAVYRPDLSYLPK
jgi:hypothetical protein